MLFSIKRKLKYLVETLIEVAKRVENRKLYEEKASQLEVIIKNISDGVFICNNEGKAIVANNKIGNIKIELDMVEDLKLYKYFDTSGNEISYENLPIIKALKGEKVYNEIMSVNAENHETIVQCNASPIYDTNGNVVFGAIVYTDFTELYNKDNTIQKQKAELESIIENMFEGVYVVDRNLNIIASSRTMREFIKITNFNNSSDLFKNIIYYDLDDNLITTHDLILKSIFKGEYIEDFRIIAYRDDEVFFLSLNGSPIFDENNNVEKAIITARDITEQVKKDKLIKEQFDTLNAIIENMSEELMIFDENGQYNFVNKAFRKRYSIDDSELISTENIMKKFKFYDEDRNPLSLGNLPTKRIIRGEKISQFREDVVDKNGLILHTEISGTPIYDSKGNFIAGVLILHNINDRLKNEENKLMQAQYDILSRTIDNLQLQFILISYPEVKINFINRQGINFLMEINQQLETLDSYIGQDAYQAYKFNAQEKSDLNVKLKELVQNNESHFAFNKEFYIENNEKFIKFIYQPMYNLNKEIMEVAVIGIDVTEEIQSKNKLEEAYKLQGEVFINVSHELKTPLNVIYSSVQMMEIYSRNKFLEDSREKISNNIKIIKQNCYRFIKLINNILDASKVKSGFFELSLSNENIVEVVENITQSVSGYIKSKGISIIFDTNIEERFIACDANKIERILLNLISNAVKFSNKYNNIYIDVLNKKDIVEITVKDNGIGIDKKELDNIFKLFYQVDKSLSRNAEGTGIGLSLVKFFVEIHGGKINVDSQVGKGTIFKIELPAKTIEEVAITTDAIKYKDNNKIEMINIEFSDIYSIN